MTQQMRSTTGTRRRRDPRSRETFDPRKPFTKAEAMQAGIDPKHLASKAYRRLLVNVYVDSSVPLTPALCAEAPLAVAPVTAWASHTSAARIIGAPVPALPGEHVSVLSAGERLNRAGVRCHVADGTSLIWNRHGVRISAPRQMFVELATQLGLIDLVVVGDWLVKNRQVTLGELREFCASSPHRGARDARRAAAYVRERVDSPMETRVRMLLVLAGLPEPEVNLTIRDVDGEPKRRYDLSWPGVKVIVEYDGRHHIDRIEEWEADLERRESIDDDGWRILVLISKNIYDRPDLTIERVARVLRSRRLPGVPRVLSDEWRPHFPVRESYLSS